MERERERARVTYKRSANWQLVASSTPPRCFAIGNLPFRNLWIVIVIVVSYELGRNLNFADNLLPPLIRVILEERLRALG